MWCSHCYNPHLYITNVSLQVKCGYADITVAAFSQIDKGAISLNTDLMAPYPYTVYRVYTLKMNDHQ